MITAEARAKPKKIYNIKRIKDLVPKVIENNGNVSKSMREVGYPETTAKNPQIVVASKVYQSEVRSVLQRYEAIRDKVLLALEQKDLSKDQTFTLASTLKGVTHDIQLLSGGKTENVGIEQERETLKAVLIDMRKP